VSDGEETCARFINPVPSQSAGAIVIIVLVPSTSDFRPGVSAAARFNEKKIAIERFAPWVHAILAPVEVDTYRLSGRETQAAPVVRTTFSQN